MKNSSIACLFVFLGVFATNVHTLAAETQTHQIDYKNLKSQDIEVIAGDSVVVVTKFQGDIGLLAPAYFPTLKTTDGKTDAVLEAPRGVHVKRLDKDTVQMWGWNAKRAGTAEITFTNPGGKNVASIKVNVKPAVKTTEYDLYSSSKLPKTLDLQVGDKVVLVSKTGIMYIAKFSANAKTTDGKTGNVLESNFFAQVVRTDGLTTEYVYQAKRAGTGTIEVVSGTHVVKTIQVTVK